MRLFVAVDLPDKVKSYLKGVQHALKSCQGRITWVNSDILHITLKFLGEVSEKEGDEIQDRLAEVRFSRFKLALNRLGFFPNEKDPRVLWINFVDGNKLKELSRSMDRQLIEYRNDHGFHDHVTLARIKSLSYQEKKNFLENVKKIHLEEQEFDVGQFMLYQSILLSQGPRYQVVRRFDPRD